MAITVSRGVFAEMSNQRSCCLVSLPVAVLILSELLRLSMVDSAGHPGRLQHRRIGGSEEQSSEGFDWDEAELSEIDLNRGRHPGVLHQRRVPEVDRANHVSPGGSSPREFPLKPLPAKRRNYFMEQGHMGSCLAEYKYGIKDKIIPICSQRVDEEDVDLERIPSVIRHVRCNHGGCACTRLGDYRCLELTTEMEVNYKPASGRIFIPYNVTVSYACACVMIESMTIYSNLPLTV